MSWILAVTTIPFSLFSTAGFDRSRFGGPLTTWILVGLASHAVAVSVAVLFVMTVLPTSERESRPMMTLFAFMICGVFRGIFVGIVELKLGFNDSFEWAYRIIGGGISALGVLSFAAVFVSVSREREHARFELARERGRLVALHHNGQADILRKHDEVHRLIAADIEPALRDITIRFEHLGIDDVDELQTLGERISQLVDKILRPLTQILYDKPLIPTSVDEWQSEQPRSRLLTSRINAKLLVNPAATTALMFLVGVPSMFARVGVYALAYAGIFGATLFFLITFFKRYVISSRLIPLALGIVEVVALQVVALVSVVHVAALFVDVYKIGAVTLSGYPGMTIVAFLMAVTLAYDQQALQYESEFAVANQLSSLEISRSAKNVWHIQRSAALHLHGRVQAGLTAASLRLVRTTHLTQLEINQIREEIAGLARSLVDIGNIHSSARIALDEITQLWDGVCNISLVEGVDLLDVIDAQEATSHAVAEIFKEAVSNSIRHGNSQNIEIFLTLASPGVLHIEVCNDGGVGDSQTRGLGSRMLDEITIDWSLSPKAGGMCLMASVALEPVSSTIEA